MALIAARFVTLLATYAFFGAHAVRDTEQEGSAVLAEIAEHKEKFGLDSPGHEDPNDLEANTDLDESHLDSHNGDHDENAAHEHLDGLDHEDVEEHHENAAHEHLDGLDHEDVEEHHEGSEHELDPDELGQTQNVDPLEREREEANEGSESQQMGKPDKDEVDNEETRETDHPTHEEDFEDEETEMQKAHRLLFDKEENEDLNKDPSPAAVNKDFGADEAMGKLKDIVGDSTHSKLGDLMQATKKAGQDSETAIKDWYDSSKVIIDEAVPKVHEEAYDTSETIKGEHAAVKEKASKPPREQIDLVLGEIEKRKQAEASKSTSP